MSPNQASLATVRQFQSETDAIREAAEPLVARATLFVLSAFLVSIVAILCLTRVDRVITSVSGKIVPAGQVNVLQALDPSIIKTIDVREGEQVQPGQLLATLDATFTSADLTQAKLQMASLETQVARDEAELKQQPLVFASKSDPDFQRYAALQKALYDQRVAQYTAQLNSFESKIKETQATIEKLRGDDARYRQRDEVLAEDREDAHDACRAWHGLAAQHVHLPGCPAGIAADIGEYAQQPD